MARPDTVAALLPLIQRWFGLEGGGGLRAQIVSVCARWTEELQAVRSGGPAAGLASAELELMRLFFSMCSAVRAAYPVAELAWAEDFTSKQGAETWIKGDLSKVRIHQVRRSPKTLEKFEEAPKKADGVLLSLSDSLSLSLSQLLRSDSSSEEVSKSEMELIRVSVDTFITRALQDAPLSSGPYLFLAVSLIASFISRGSSKEDCLVEAHDVMRSALPPDPSAPARWFVIFASALIKPEAAGRHMEILSDLISLRFV